MRVRQLALIICGTCGLLWTFAGFAPARAQQFVQICGQGTFFIPGTNNCVDANQILANAFGVARQASTVFTGIAMSTALVDPFMPDHANYAISIHEASFEHKTAFGVAGLLRLQGNLMLSAGLAVAKDAGSFTTFSQLTQTDTGTRNPIFNWDQFNILGRVGLSYSW